MTQKGETKFLSEKYPQLRLLSYENSFLEHYETPMFEEGVQLKDKVYLKMDLNVKNEFFLKKLSAILGIVIRGIYSIGYYSLDLIVLFIVFIPMGITALLVPGEKISYNELSRIYRKETGTADNKHMMYFFRRNKKI